MKVVPYGLDPDLMFTDPRAPHCHLVLSPEAAVALAAVYDRLIAAALPIQEN